MKQTNAIETLELEADTLQSTIFKKGVKYGPYKIHAFMMKPSRLGHNWKSSACPCNLTAKFDDISRLEGGETMTLYY